MVLEIDLGYEDPIWLELVLLVALEPYLIDDDRISYRGVIKIKNFLEYNASMNISEIMEYLLLCKAYFLSYFLLIKISDYKLYNLFILW